MTPELNWLTDPTVFAVNRLDAHSDHVGYKTEAEAETGLTSLRQSLDGAWRFAWSANPAARPADFYKPDADLTAFGTIRVPGHIELQGYGQIQYTNTLYPWDGRAALRPPQINWDDDPVGSYVKEFDLDEDLRGQRQAKERDIDLQERRRAADDIHVDAGEAAQDARLGDAHERQGKAKGNRQRKRHKHDRERHKEALKNDRQALDQNDRVQEQTKEHIGVPRLDPRLLFKVGQEVIKSRDAFNLHRGHLGDLLG